MSAIARALLDELGPEDLAAFAERLAPFLGTASPPDDGWLDTKQAAAYAGCSVHALYRAMKDRDVRFEQEAPGCKAWFRRSDLDAWRAGQDG